MADNPVITRLQQRADALTGLIALAQNGHLKGAKHIIAQDLALLATEHGYAGIVPAHCVKRVLGEARVFPRVPTNSTRVYGFRRKTIRVAVKDGRLAALLQDTNRRIANLRRAQQQPQTQRDTATVMADIDRAYIDHRDRQRRDLIILEDDPNEILALEEGYGG